MTPVESSCVAPVASSVTSSSRCVGTRRCAGSGTLSWVKASFLAPLVSADPLGWLVEGWVAWAGRVTVRLLREDVERALALWETDREGFRHGGGLPPGARDDREIGASRTVPTEPLAGDDRAVGGPGTGAADVAAESRENREIGAHPTPREGLHPRRAPPRSPAARAFLVPPRSFSCFERCCARCGAGWSKRRGGSRPRARPSASCSTTPLPAGAAWTASWRRATRCSRATAGVAPCPGARRCRTVELEDDLAALLESEQPLERAARETIVMDLFRRGTVSLGRQSAAGRSSTDRRKVPRRRRTSGHLGLVLHH